MVRHGKTTFQESWLEDSSFKHWLKRTPNDQYAASCVFCPGSISVSTMGRQALVSHMKGQKHLSKVKSHTQSPMIAFLKNKPTSIVSNATTSTSTSQPERPESSFTSLIMNPQISTNIPTSPPMASTVISNEAPTQSNFSNTIDKFKIKADITKAEAVWCLHSVFSHKSFRAAARDIQLLKFMFPSVEVLNKMALERTKIGYLISYGIAPHFKSLLLEDLKDCKHFVISFDESLNKISQSQQMDIVVRFWTETTNQVSTRYFTSAFLEKATAVDMLNAFLAALNDLDLSKLLQIAMDGPNVNKKFLNDLIEHRANVLKIENKMMNIGTCGLHALNCAFKNAMKVTGWDIISYLRASYNFFKDHPARRGEFVKITQTNIFPKKFCTVRWLENASVAQNALDVLPHMRVFLEAIENKKSTNTQTRSFQVLKDKVKDPLLGAKVAFFKTIANDFQPILEEYQSNAPLAPFLYTTLKNLIINEMERFIVPEKLTPSIKILEKKENILPASKINVGIAAKCEIGKCCDKVTTSQVNTFKNECKNALSCLVKALIEKSPLEHDLTKFISSLDPKISPTSIGKKRFENLMVSMTECNIISSQTAEKAQKEFSSICSLQKQNLTNFQKFLKSADNKSNEINRLDDFWMKQLRESKLESSSLNEVIQIVLILSHGNAEVERGFSVNKECVIENLKEDSLVAMRIVYDTIKKYGSVENVPINNALLLSCRNSRDRYTRVLEQQKIQNNEKTQQKAAKRKNQILVRELEEKKRKILDEARKEAESIERQISNLP